MSKKILLTGDNASQLFRFEKLSIVTNVSSFACSIEEYNIWLQKEALSSQKDCIAVTWILFERETNKIASYMALIADAIKLSLAEKELHNLNYPFRTMPALKIAKLAVDSSVKQKYTGIGSYMIRVAHGFADESNNANHACRFLTVDADIEHDPGVIEFYTKNGFLPNKEMNNKKSKTINMRRDIFKAIPKSF